MSLTVEEAKTRVADGARWLDIEWPHWYLHIDVNALDMGADCSCVLGQMTGSFNTARFKIWPESLAQRAIGKLTGREPLGARLAVALGFDAPESLFELERESDFKVLQDAWLDAIALRRFPDATTPVAESIAAQKEQAQ